MNPTPSPIAPPIPLSRPAVTPLQSALAAQIGALTHLVDGMERFCHADRGSPAAFFVGANIAALHPVIDRLNELYAAGLNTQLDLDSLNRRLKWAQFNAEKHHNGNIAACERESAAIERAEAFRAVLLRLVDSPDLRLTNMDPKTLAAIDEAKRLLYPDAS